MRIRLLPLAVLLAASTAAAQRPTNDPFPTPLPAAEGAVTVGVREFARLPEIDGVASRMMVLVDEPAGRRLFVNDMRGPIYTVSHDGQTVRLYLDVNAPGWKVAVQSSGRERGVQSIALHPQFNQRGTPGFGKLYTFTDSADMTAAPDFKPLGTTRTHDTVLLEWTAKNPSAETYDGGAPRELVRFAQPFANHNGGLIAFNPLALPSSGDYGVLYIGSADGGSGGDPLRHAQNLSSPLGKLLRINPLGRNSANGKYGIPDSNPFARDNDPNTLAEIYAYGLRNPQRFTWDAKNGNLFLADIGQNIVEEVDLVQAGANLGWNDWEGSFRFISREGVDLDGQRRDPSVTYPIVEYGQVDPLLQPQSAVTMGVAYRGTAIKPLADRLVFGDIPSGEIFHVSADDLPKGGQDAVRRVLLREASGASTLLELIKAANARQGKPPATRADLRFGTDAGGGQVFLLNKGDGIVRVLTDAR
jgi:hypothetical protein